MQNSIKNTSVCVCVCVCVCAEGGCTARNVSNSSKNGWVFVELSTRNRHDMQGYASRVHFCFSYWCAGKPPTKIQFYYHWHSTVCTSMTKLLEINKIQSCTVKCQHISKSRHDIQEPGGLYSIKVKIINQKPLCSNAPVTSPSAAENSNMNTSQQIS